MRFPNISQEPRLLGLLMLHNKDSSRTAKFTVKMLSVDPLWDFSQRIQMQCLHKALQTLCIK